MQKRFWRLFSIAASLLLWSFSASASASAATSANWCLDSDYQDPSDPDQLFNRKLGLKTGNAATKTDCVEMRSKSFLVKEAVLASASRADTGRKGVRVLLCNFDRLFYGGIARYAAPPTTYKDVERETKTLFDSVKGLVKKAVDPRKDALQFECDNFGWNLGSKNSVFAEEINLMVNSNATFFVGGLCGTSRDSTDVIAVEEWVKVIDQHCKPRPGEINDPEAWKAAQEAILAARREEGGDDGGSVPIAAQRAACAAETKDKGVLLTDGKQAAAACTRPGRVALKGTWAHYCPSKRAPGPLCGTHFAVQTSAQEACTYPAALSTPEGATRYYCPPNKYPGSGGAQFYALQRDAQADCTRPGLERTHGGAHRFYCPALVVPGPLEGQYFAREKDAFAACTRPGAELTVLGAGRYYCPARVLPGPNNGQWFAYEHEARKACTRPGAEQTKAGATRYYCPPRRMKPGPLGEIFALQSEARANCTHPGAEVTYAGSASYFCPEPRQGIYRAKIEDLAGCKNVVAEQDRAGSNRYYCRSF